MTLQEIKDEYAEEQLGISDYNDFWLNATCDEFDTAIYEIAKRYAKAKLEEAAQGLERHIIYEKAVIDKLNMPDKVRDAKIRLDVYVEIQTSITETPLD